MHETMGSFDVQQISLRLTSAGDSCARDGWIRMLSLNRTGGESTCGWTEDSWSAALRELRARNEPYLHTLLVAALDESASPLSWIGKEGLLWAIEDREVASGAVIAVTSFRMTAAKLRNTLKASTLIKDTDVSALAMMLGSESSSLKGAAASALGVLQVGQHRRVVTGRH